MSNEEQPVNTLQNENNIDENPSDANPENSSGINDSEPINWKSKKGIILLSIVGGVLLLIILSAIFSNPPSPTSTTNAGTENVLIPGEDIPVQTVKDAENIASEIRQYNPPAFGINPEEDNLPEFFQDANRYEEPDIPQDDPFAYLEETLENKQSQPSLDHAFRPIDEAEEARLNALTQRRVAPSIMVTSPASNENNVNQGIAQQNPLNPFPATVAEESAPPDENPGGFQRVQAPLQNNQTQPPGINRFSTGPDTDAQSNMAIYRPDQDYRLLQGTSMQMTLETAINSNLQGTVRALSNMPVYSANGKHLLIPSRSRFIGEYQVAQTGMRRLYIIWQRIITPQGIEVFLQAPGTDTQGRSGVKGKLNRRFIERFATAMIFSVINTFNRGNNTDGVSLHYSNASQTAAEIALENSVNLAPIIQIKPGALINAQAAEDIDFKAALNAFANAHIQILPDELYQYNYLDPSRTDNSLYDEQIFSRDEIIVELADADKTIEHDIKQADKAEPVYLIPKHILDKQKETNRAGSGKPPDPAASLPPAGAARTATPDCAGLLLVESKMLSELVEDWARRCQDLPLHWTVGGAHTWRDFIIEKSGFLPLPQGSDSLASYLQATYNVNMIRTPDAIIIVENPNE